MEGGSTSTCAYDELESIILNGSLGPCSIPLEYLKRITNNFSDERLLGEGGFGKVYKGVLQNGKMVAVKRLGQLLKPGVQERQFENEVYHLMRLKHPNIVQFLGYCYETRNECVEHDGKHIFAEMQQKLICLEYVPNGSLDRHLSDESSGHEWHTRYKIIKGICRGLLYLHEECQCQFSASIIHLDLKPGNILLDEYMGPKFADFGLSRLFEDNKTQTCATFLSGSLGYMAPEYLFGRIVTTKADIYNLGVIIIEIITGSKVNIFSFSSPTSWQEFQDRVINNWRNRLGGGASSETDSKQIMYCLEIGLGCIKFDREERPTSREVIERLDRWETTNCNVSNEKRPAADQILRHTEEKAPVSTTGYERIVSPVRPNITGSRRRAAADDFSNTNANTGTGLISHGSGARGFFHRQLSRVMRLVSRVQRKRRRPSSSPSPLELGILLEDLEDLEESPRRHPHPEPVIEKYTIAQMKVATKGFSLESKIGEGRSGTEYHGHLPDGREVVIKRRKPGPHDDGSRLLKSEFLSEVTFLSSLRHKHLVGLVGYCVEKEERLLVCEYMSNGTLYDHLHPTSSSPSPSPSPVMSSWKLRIKILLDASRGIEYLHCYPVPSIIHRNIKSLNILLDASWRARVSGFKKHLIVMAGTVGYMDPEYYYPQNLTVKRDVYGFGVVMLEVLTGKPAILDLEKAEGARQTSLVDYAVPSIVSGELGNVLDPRMPEPAAHEAEALELLAYTALHCVRLEGKDRPAMDDIVANLENAFALCEGNFYGDLVKSPSSDSPSVITPIHQDSGD